MSKVFSFAVVLVVAAIAAGAAHAQDPTGQRIVAQERAKGLLESAPQAEVPVHGILAQERGRRWDARLLQPSGAAPILVAGEPDRFDVADAGVGGAAGLAVALLGAAAVALSGGLRRQRAAGASSARQ